MDLIDELRINREREMLAALLTRWQNGEITPWDVISEAEALEEPALAGREVVVSEGMTVLREFSHSDPRSIGAAIMQLLAFAHHSYVLPEDIPTILQFLNTPFGQEAEAWHRFDAYWDAIDFTARESRVHMLYYGRSLR